MLLLATGVAGADPAPRKPGPEDAKARALLDKIVAGPDSTARKAAIAELEQVAPSAIDAIGEWLMQPRTIPDPDPRRAVLLSIEAAVPDKKGQFRAQRQSSLEKRADDKFDWMPPLLALDAATPALGEVIASIAAIRALASTKDIHAAQLVFDTAFGDTIVYRDECGRYLRKMEPYSIPALTRESQRRSGDRKRYATFQLERLDRQDANNALAAATGNEALQIAILDTFRETKHREAVHAFFTDPTVSPRVLERLAEPDPERASQVVQKILDRPSFAWETDADSLLHELKADYYAKPVMPGVTPKEGTQDARRQVWESSARV